MWFFDFYLERRGMFRFFQDAPIVVFVWLESDTSKP
ncbi:hypothetical protein ALP98_05414 [Pseudomonas viridiflava]|uniref:Uncharacterized protein n=2 Tax=Pseudomonas syringae group TaxID=136849 RepID=A0A3M4P2M1_PSEVI|nr:hypothetical protein ALQ30_04708 [Pseudomonas syringae pv. persicae]RMQ08781.1 hypothetical protein ALQ09_04936 [Pseudomonas viridiflava]RMQ72392.1 hypothetical protein ALP98_05414 [Pseudomonas viridiflava]